MDSMGMGGGSMDQDTMKPMVGKGDEMQGKVPTRTEPMPQGGSMGMK